MTTPQEPRDDDEPTMLPEAYLQQNPDGSTRPLADQSQNPDGQEPSGPPPTAPYGQPQDPYAQPQYGQAYGQPGYPPPAYGAPPQAYGAQPQAYGAQPQGYGGYTAPPPNHPSAQTAMVLGLVGLIGFFFCGITVVLSPFAWRMGSRARREIDDSHGGLGGRDSATVGYITGIIGTVILGLAVLAIVAVIGLVTVGTVSSTTSG